jgi:hypothetical protein
VADGILKFLPVKITPTKCIFFPNGSTAPWGPRPPHFSRLHDHTLFRHTTIGRTLLDEGPARRNTQHSQETDIHALGVIRTHNLSKRAAVDPRLRPSGHWDRPYKMYHSHKFAQQAVFSQTSVSSQNLRKSIIVKSDMTHEKLNHSWNITDFIQWTNVLICV